MRKFYFLALLMVIVIPMSIYGETGDVIPNRGGGFNQDIPTFPQDPGFITQSPIFPAIPPMMIEAFAEPYHTGIITFRVTDGALECSSEYSRESKAEGVSVDTDTYHYALKHIVIYDDGVYEDNSVARIYTPGNNQANAMTLHGGEIRDDDTFHLLGIISTTRTAICGEKLAVIDIVGECDGSLMQISSRPPSLFNITASGDGFHAACIR